MAIPISVKELLLARRVESTRIEYKQNWNPQKVLHSICAFANDIDNTGGGYIVLGVEEKDGRPVLPPIGLRKDSVDQINKELLGLCKFLEPNYSPIVEPVVYEGVDLLVLWVPGGNERPYKSPVAVARDVRSERACYIRKMASTVRATPMEEKELYSLAGDVPFDDRINHKAPVEAIKRGLLESYLTNVGSDLVKTLYDRPLRDVANDMLLLDGVPEDEHPRNVALLFFSEEPEKFFPFAWIDIVDKPDPTGQGMREKTIKGPIDRQLTEALAYIRNTFLKEVIYKDPDHEKAVRRWNYPYAAIEEALSNAVFHKSYAIHEPITVMILPDRIEITSVPGPDRSIRDQDIKDGHMVSRRCRNRRIWEFLKELDLVEGRNTGIPTINSTMRDNGSPMPIYLTDEERSYFTVVLPVHETFLRQEVALNNCDKSPDDAQQHQVIISGQEKVALIGAIDAALAQDGVKKRADLINRWASVLQLLKRDERAPLEKIAESLGISQRSLDGDIATLKRLGLLTREGASVGGAWKVMT